MTSDQSYHINSVSEAVLAESHTPNGITVLQRWVVFKCMFVSS